jgi:hypothetical protein
MRASELLISADEHAQTSVSEHGAVSALGPPGAQTAQKQHAGLLKAARATIRARIRLPEGAARKASASARRACIPDTYAASGPNREPGRILIPGDGAVGDQEAQNKPACLPGNGGYAPPAGYPVSTTPGAMVSGAQPSCNRQVTSTSIHMARPGPASAPRGHAPQ